MCDAAVCARPSVCACIEKAAYPCWLAVGCNDRFFFLRKEKSCDANGPDCRATQETLDVGRTKNSRQVARAQCKTAGRPPSKGVRRTHTLCVSGAARRVVHLGCEQTQAHVGHTRSVCARALTKAHTFIKTNSPRSCGRDKTCC